MFPELVFQPLLLLDLRLRPTGRSGPMLKVVLWFIWPSAHLAGATALLVLVQFGSKLIKLG